MLIPAHAWTPHFSVFGSGSGFDSLEEYIIHPLPSLSTRALNTILLKLIGVVRISNVELLPSDFLFNTPGFEMFFGQ